MGNLTVNLQKWRAELTRLKESVLPTAIVEVVERYTDEFKDLLWEEIKLAISDSPEFDYPVFRSGLKLAAYGNGVITIEKSIGGNNLISVKIDMDKTAGNIEDYVKGVNVTRGEGKISRGSASAYWAYFIYKQAREGLKIKAKRKPGQRGRTPTRQKEGAELYKETIATRMSTAGTPAPFWSILDGGLPSASPLDAGGWAYPSPPSTGFVYNAELKIKVFANEKVARAQERLYARLEREEYGGSQILDQLDDVITEFQSSPRAWTPGDVLRTLDIGEKKYNLYITPTGLLGFSQ